MEENNPSLLELKSEKKKPGEILVEDYVAFHVKCIAVMSDWQE
jgi:hypothetical protein